MAWIGALAAVAGSVLSSSMQSDAAGSASQAQGDASAGAIAEQRRQYDLNRTDLAPWRDTGTAAQKRLAYLLGIGGSSGSGGTYLGKHFSSPDELKSLITDAVTKGGFDPSNINKQYNALVGGGNGIDVANYERVNPSAAGTVTVDPAVDQTPAGTGSEFGELTRTFTAADRDADPVYQSGLEFGLKEGEGGINARALASGVYDSGATLKALMRFGNDYGSTKANEAFNRFNANNTNIYNRLSGVSGGGQTAANQTVAAGTAASNNISELMTGAGNARAAGIVGGSNAWGSVPNAINSGINYYNSSKFLQSLQSNDAYNTGMNDINSQLYKKDGGLLVGPKHEEGGIALEAEGGEYVIPAAVVRRKGPRFFERLIANYGAQGDYQHG